MACFTAPRGIFILSILKYLAYSGSSFSAGRHSFFSSSSGSSGFLSRIAGSFPSRTMACFTAPRGIFILSILKYLAYSGSSFSAGRHSFFSSSTCFSGSSGFLSRIDGSFPSRTMACLTAAGGILIFSILKYLAYSGSSFSAAPPFTEGICNDALSFSIFGVLSSFFVCNVFSSSSFKSSMDESFPSRVMACLTASRGILI